MPDRVEEELNRCVQLAFHGTGVTRTELVKTAMNSWSSAQTVRRLLALPAEYYRTPAEVLDELEHLSSTA